MLQIETIMYQIALPHAQLRDYVDCYWQLRVTPSDPFQVEEDILVDGKADLIFNFGAAYQRITPRQTQTIKTGNYDGQREHPIQIAQSGEIHLVGVRFKAGGFCAFSPIPSSELKHQVLEIETLLGPAGTALEQVLHDNLFDFKNQVRQLNRFLRARLNLRDDFQLAQAISKEIQSAQGKISIKGLSEQFAYSGRHINRIYQQNFGFSPKFHARIERFQFMLGQLMRQPSISQATLSQISGYYDQSHLQKEFMAFTGHTLTDYKVILELKQTMAPPPNLVQFLQDDPI